MIIELHGGAEDVAPEEVETESEEVAGGIPEVHKKFLDIIYNQLEVDPYACTVVATYGALSNLTGKIVPYQVMRDTLAKMAKDGKFRKGFGASLDDGTAYALADFNAWAGTSFKRKAFAASFFSIHSALSTSPVVHGIKYGPQYLADEQDDGEWNLPANQLAGKQGHAVYWCKTNPTDPAKPRQAKFVESYAGKLVRNVIYVPDLDAYLSMMFKTAYRFE